MAGANEGMTQAAMLHRNIRCLITWKAHRRAGAVGFLVAPGPQGSGSEAPAAVQTGTRSLSIPSRRHESRHPVSAASPHPI